MKRRTLFLLDALSIGGSELKTVRLANRLTETGSTVDLGYLNPPETLLAELGPGVGRVNLDRHGKFSWKSLRRLERYLRAQGITRVIAVNLYPLAYVQATRWLMGADAPSCAVTINTTEFHTRKHTAQMAIYAPLLRRTEDIVFGCRYQLGLWVERYRLPEARCRYIYNGVDSEFYSLVNLGDADPRAALGLAHDEFIVGTVGKFRPEKRQQDLIEVIALLRARGVRASALIVGGGGEENALRDLAHSRGISEFVRFPGQLRDVRPALAAMDVFVLTSISETFSNAALEAMSMSKAVVLSDVGGAREMVKEGVNGQLYPAANVQRLAHILAEMAGDRAIPVRLGIAACELVKKDFSFARMVDEYRRLCEQ